MVNWNRLIEVALVFLVALAVTAARVIHNLLEDEKSFPSDEEIARVWRHRLYWAIGGEVAAIISFVIIAEAIVIYWNYESPVAVLIGAGAAVLGYPFLAGMFRKRVAQRLQQPEGSDHV